MGRGSSDGESSPDPAGQPDAIAGGAPVERAPRAARNSLFALLAFVYPTVLTVVLTPFIVHSLGTERYGLFSLATIFVSVLGLLDLGMSPAIVKFVSDAAARRDSDRAVGEIVGVSLLFYAAIGVMGSAGAALAAWLFLDDLFNVSPHLRSTATFAFAIAGLGFLFTMLMTAFSALPLALQRFDIQALVRFTLSSCTALLTVLVLTLGLGLRGLVIALVVEPVLGLILFFRVGKRLFPALRPVPRWDPDLMRRLSAFSGYAFLANIAGVVLFQFDRVLLGAISGVVAVTFYVIPGTLAQRLHAAASALTAVVLPASSDLMARDDYARVRALYIRATRIALLFLLSFGIPAICFARPILRYWLGADFAREGTTVLQLLVGTYLLAGLTTVPYYIVLGAGRPRIAALFSALTAGTNLVLISFLIPLYGIVGAAAGYLGSMVAAPPFIWYVERRVLTLPGSFWPHLGVRLTIPVAIQVGVCLLLLPLATSLGLTILLLAGTIPLLAGVWFGLGFSDRGDRQLLLQLAGIRRARK